MKYITLVSIYICSLVLLMPLLARPVYAETEVVIQGNGESTENQITFNQTQNTQTHQDNQAVVQSSVVSQSATGDNSASDATGSVNISTGDSQTQTQVNNSLNANTVNQGCCTSASDQTTKVGILGNGEGSHNTIGISDTSVQTTTQTNNATINNNIHIKTDTGSNTVSDNIGSASIKTGDSRISTKVINITNSNFVSQPSSGDGGIKTKIVGNTQNSNNQISLNIQNQSQVFQKNTANTTNNLNYSSNTGGNKAQFNNGEVIISTGDTTISTTLVNESNTNQVEIRECSPNSSDHSVPNQNDSSSHEAPPTASLPTSSSSGGNSSGILALGGLASGGFSLGGIGDAQASSDVLGTSSSGQVLPATGGSMTLLLTLFSVLMFVLGLYLRMHPGVDPGKVLVIHA